MKLSVIVPLYNEAATIQNTLNLVQDSRREGVELICVDGGSSDNSIIQAKPLADFVISAPKGRALQMNVGAEISSGDWLLFLHADTLLPENFLHQVLSAEDAGAGWGFFPVRLSGAHPLLRCVERGMNWRSKLTKVATGDQAIFIRRDHWEQLKGFANIPLMEDIEMSKRLRLICHPWLASVPLVTSSRRWEKGGIIKTICLMWYLRLLYFIGVSPSRLATLYR